MALIRAITYEEDPIEYGQPLLMLCFRYEEKHLYPSTFLRNFVASLEDDEEMDATNKTSLLNELKWFLSMRKHWKLLLRFIDRA